MKTLFAIAAVALLTLMVPAVVAQTNIAGSPAASGIRGQAVLWPTAPVQRQGQPASKPFPNATVIIRAPEAQSELARTNADAEGKFQFTLTPGEYVVESIVPEKKNRHPRAESKRVTVAPGTFTNIVLKFDTGLR